MMMAPSMSLRGGGGGELSSAATFVSSSAPFLQWQGTSISTSTSIASSSISLKYDPLFKGGDHLQYQQQQNNELHVPMNQIYSTYLQIHVPHTNPCQFYSKYLLQLPQQLL